MASRFQGRLPPLMREALAELMSTFILVVCNDFKSTFMANYYYYYYYYFGAFKAVFLLGKMNVYSFVSRWNRFELLIATFRLLYC